MVNTKYRNTSRARAGLYRIQVHLPIIIRLQRCRGSRISALNTLAKTIVGRSRGRRSAQNATTTARWRPRPTRRTAQHTLSYGRALRGAADAPSGVQHQWQQWLAAASRASRPTCSPAGGGARARIERRLAGRAAACPAAVEVRKIDSLKLSSAATRPYKCAKSLSFRPV